MPRHPARFLSVAILTVLFFVSFPAWAQEMDQTIAKQAMIMDFDTGAILLEKNADERMPTSSMSKTITIYAVFDALKNGRLSMDTQLRVSEKAWRMGGSKMFVDVGGKIRVEDLIQGVVVQSGNDATIVLAEGISGSEEAFADLLNGIAAKLDMKDSHFANASGWPDPDHYSTARDLAKLGVATIRDFPDYYHYYGEREFVYNNIRQPNRNPLLFRVAGADGIKTGHTEAGGYGLIGSAVKDGRRVVMVLNGMPDDAARAQESARLMEWALRAFENVTLFKQDETVETLPVVMGRKNSIALQADRDIRVTIPSSVRNDLKVEAVYNAPLIAPVRKGQQIGVLKISVPRLQSFEVPLLSAEDVPRLGFFPGLLAKAKLMLSGGKIGE